MDYIEEEIEINLMSDHRQSRKDLHMFLLTLGCKSEDYLYFLPRSDDVKPWQIDVLFTLETRIIGNENRDCGDEVAKDESLEWDEISIRYLISSIPRNNIEKLIYNLELLVAKFDLYIIFRKKSIANAEALKTNISYIFDEIESLFGTPGSEDLAILIESQYPGKI